MRIINEGKRNDEFYGGERKSVPYLYSIHADLSTIFASTIDVLLFLFVLLFLLRLRPESHEQKDLTRALNV